MITTPRRTAPALLAAVAALLLAGCAPSPATSAAPTPPRTESAAPTPAPEAAPDRAAFCADIAEQSLSLQRATTELLLGQGGGEPVLAAAAAIGLTLSTPEFVAEPEVVALSAGFSATADAIDAAMVTGDAAAAAQALAAAPSPIAELAGFCAGQPGW